MPTFSVIIPCFKQGAYLKTAIDSALAQAVDVQVIVVDDGSPDDTAAVAGAFGDRVLLIRQANAGVAAARNAGLARATGEFVNFLDADDYLIPAMLTAAAAAMTAGSAAVSACGWKTVDPAGVPLRQFPAPTFAPDSFHALLPDNLCPPVCYVFQRSVLEQVGGFDTERKKGGHADWDLLLRVAATGEQFVSVPQVLVGYRVHPASLSGNFMGMFDSGMAVLDKISRVHGRCPACGNRFDDAYRHLYDQYADFLLRPTFTRRASVQRRLQVVRHFLARSVARPHLAAHSVRYVIAAATRKLNNPPPSPRGDKTC